MSNLRAARSLANIVKSGRAARACLDLEMIITIRMSPAQQLPQARERIGDEEHKSPSFVLRDMHALVCADVLEFFSGYGEDDMAKDDAAEWKRARE